MASTTVRKAKVKVDQLSIHIPLIVASGQTIYEGTLVGKDDNGYAIPADDTHKCVGMAIEQKTAGQTVTVVYNNITFFVLPGVCMADLGKTAYAVDNDTLTLIENDAIVGKIIGVSGESAIVHLTLDLAGGESTIYKYFPMLSGKYYDTSYAIPIGTPQARNFGKDTLVAVPLYVPKTVTFDRIKCWPDVTDATTFLRLGLYEDNRSSYPGNLIFDSGSLAFVQNDTYKNISQQLTKGLYWMVIVHNRTNPASMFQCSIEDSMNILGITDQAGPLPAGKEMVYEVSFTFAALPSTFPSGATSYTLDNLPVIAMRVL